MKWSISKSKIFLSCQRKWFYSDIFGAWNARDAFRRESYLLGNLQSIQAWRGSVVDAVIENFILKRIYFQNRLPSLEESINYSTWLVTRQLEFGRGQKFREGGMTKTKAKEDYAAFFDIEYGGKLEENSIQEAIDEIYSSLQNLLNSGFLQNLMQYPEAKFIPQRDLQIQMNGFYVVSKPDLIFFPRDSPPIIVDWKVHAGRNTDYWLQLGIYAYVLHKVCSSKAHQDFPKFHVNPKYKCHEIELIEYQLLSNTQKKYNLSEEEIFNIEDYIYKYGNIMSIFYDENKLDPHNYQTAFKASTCKYCNFQKLCREG